MGTDSINDTRMGSSSDEEGSEPRTAGGKKNSEQTAPSQSRVRPVKRSCNNCRQQKLRCDVVQSPFSACSRCRRLGKTCDVGKEFKRVVGKREKMQIEIDDLKRQLRQASGSQTDNQKRDNRSTLAQSHDIAAHSVSTKFRKLGSHILTGETLDDLYKEYFASYHHFLPILDSQYGPDHYFNLSQLLGWSIVMVAARRFKSRPNLLRDIADDYNKLLWSTIIAVTQPYHNVKALCLICLWPIPVIQSFTDPSYNLSGMMMQIAVINMLHLPLSTDLPPGRALPDSEQSDRRVTWMACNIVAENMSCVYGLPPLSMHDRILRHDFLLPSDIAFKGLVDQLKISQFCNTATKILYCDVSDPMGLVAVAQRESALDQLRRDYQALDKKIGHQTSMVTRLHLLAANLHFNVFAFFLGSSPNKEVALGKLYEAACTLLQTVMDFETSEGTLLEHINNFLAQITFSAIFVLLKLLNSSFAACINPEHGKALFNASILAARRVSIQDGDLASRIATRVPPQWRTMGGGAPWIGSTPDPLELSVQAGMSMSHRYDCMWKYHRAVESASRTGEKAIIPSAATEPEVQAAASLPEEPSSLQVLPADTEFMGLGMDDLDLFTSMGWMMSEQPWNSWESND